MKIAIIGSGIAGNTIAHQLHRAHDVTVFEAAAHVGGHTHTHYVESHGATFNVDTGFIVFNDWTYPNFVKLLDELHVASEPSRMSFSVRVERSGLEYNGTSLNTLFAQRRNILRPSFHRMLRDILRFNREAPVLLESGHDITLGAYLADCVYGREFIDHYLIPMGAAIWSTDPERMLEFPAHHFVSFLDNHGMLSVDNRPLWRVICGGSARYVEELVAPFRSRIRLNTPVQTVRRAPDGVWIKARGLEPECFDRVFIACHSDQALALLADPTPLESQVLGAIAYQANEVVLHTDTRLLPRTRRAWAAWNYHVAAERGARVALTYNMNILQNLQAHDTFCVTLNRTEHIAADKIIKRLRYHHPLYTRAAAAAQQRQHDINRGNRSYFCGAYWRNGFHEDGLVSALNALRHFERDTNVQRNLSRVG